VYDLTDEEVVENYDSSKKVLPIVLFLGVDEGYVLEDGKDGGVVFEGGYKGRPYFAVDVGELVERGELPPTLLGEGREWLKQGLQLGIVMREGEFLFFIFFSLSDEMAFGGWGWDADDGVGLGSGDSCPG